MDYSKIVKLASLFSEAAGERNEYMRLYMASRYHSKRKSLIEELGGKCKSCGDVNNLHIDHMNAKDKTFRAADVHSVSDARVQKEKKNFQLLCGPCHKKKTHEEWDYSAPKPRHGTYWMARKYKCKCEPCQKAYKEKMKEWRQQKSKGGKHKEKAEEEMEELENEMQ